MNTADRKKEAFKRKAAYIYKEYKFLAWIALGGVLLSLVLTARNVYTFVSERNVEPWSVETIVDTPYAIDIQHEEDDERIFAQVYGDLTTTDLANILRGVSGYYGAEVPIYHMAEGASIEERAPFYAEGMQQRVFWSDSDKMTVIAYQDIPQVTPNVVQVDDWDILHDDSYLLDDIFAMHGYVDAEATTTESIALMLGIADLMEDVNSGNEKAVQGAYHFEFQHGNDTLLFHTGHPRILGTSRVAAFE